jgi:hypothetical protein
MTCRRSLAHLSRPQRSILEADQEEENEEAGDMNDEEINEIISRSEEETALFHQMDLQRDRDLAESWKAQGHRGKPPPLLMGLEELPECYRNDALFEIKEEDEGPEGRGARRRTVVSYNDGLSDEQWAMVSTLSACALLLSGTLTNDAYRPSRTARTSRSSLSAIGPLAGK